MADPFILTSDDVKRLRIAIEHRTAFKALFADTNSTPPVSGITQLTGDVTAGPGSGSQAATITAGAVTYAKIQNETDDTLLGRSAGSNGPPMEIAIGSGMVLSGGTLSSVGGGSSAGTLWRFKAKTSATSGYPGDGYMLWDNATQTSATHLLFAHLTTDDLDVDLVLAQITSGKKLILQDSDVSGNFQEWSVTGSGINTNPNTPTSYWTFPVTLISSGGTGTTGFSNNHQLVVFVVGAGATGTVTSVDVSGGTTGLSTSGGPITSSGTITLSGTLIVGNGGTGTTSFTANGIILGNSTSALQVTSAMTDGQLLVGQTGSAPLPKTISGDWTMAASGAATIGPAAVTYAKIQNVTDNRLLGRSAGSAGSPMEITVGSGLSLSGGSLTSTGSGGTVTSVDVSGGTTGLTTSGGPVTGSGTITIAGTLVVSNGGTGVGSLTANGILYGGTTVGATAAMTDGQLLVGQTSAAPLPKTVSGDATMANTGALTLANSGVSANTYGSGTQVGQFTVDAKGRITSATNVNITLSLSVLDPEILARLNLSVL